MFAGLYLAIVSLGIFFYIHESSSRGQNDSSFDPIKYVKKRLTVWAFLIRGAQMIEEGYKKANGKAFEIPGPDHSHVFVSSAQHIAEIRRAGRNELSLFGATRQMFQPAHTMLGFNWFDERGSEGIGYVRAVGSFFPRRLITIMPEMETIVKRSFDAFAAEHQAKHGNMDLSAYALHKDMLCTLNAFCFFGRELVEDKAFMADLLRYNEMVITAAEVLRLLPEFMKSWVGPRISHASIQARLFAAIDRIVTCRLQETGDKENDMVQWIIDTAPSDLGWDSRRITYEIIAIWFGSVHALSATITHALFDLCEYREYLTLLRGEANGPAYDEFIQTSKGLPLLDSFIKESSRMGPIESMSGRRQALKDFTFSDGTCVRKGDWACVPAKAILNDEAYFPRADTFQGFRFAPRDAIPDGMGKVAQPEGPSKFADISQNYHSWGIGGIVCPGRFYAAISIKLIVAHFLRAYDFEFAVLEKKRSMVWRSYVLPREDVLVSFSTRRS